MANVAGIAAIVVALLLTDSSIDVLAPIHSLAEDWKALFWLESLAVATFGYAWRVGRHAPGQRVETWPEKGHRHRHVGSCRGACGRAPGGPGGGPAF